MRKPIRRLARVVLPAMFVTACQSTANAPADMSVYVPRTYDLAGRDLSMPDLSPRPAVRQTSLINPLRFKDVDILFVIDGSPSMAPKQKVLATNFPQFINAIDATGVDYHIGIATADLGFNPQLNTGNSAPWNTIPTCNTYLGDDGVLQNIPCTSRGLVGEAASACTSLCPNPSFVPKNGGRFISKDAGVTNVPVSTGMGYDQGPQYAFQCLALVGDIGCGDEQQLESVKRALDNHRPDNAGFNRGSSVLAVIFVTDEDDCSVQLAKRDAMNPLTPNAAMPACTTPGDTVDQQCFNIDYRCMGHNLKCNEPMNTKGAKTGCSERPDSFLSSVDQYVSFFAGLPNPNLILGGVWTPTLLDNLTSDPAKPGALNVDYVGGTSDTSSLNRARKTAAGCYNPDPTLTTDTANGFFGQAQLRLSTFLRRFPAANTTESSICDTSNYSTALGRVVSNITNSLGAKCLNKVPLAVGGAPDCVVGYVDAATPMATPAAPLPVCSDKCCSYFATDSKPNAANDPNYMPMPNPHLAAEMTACSADPDCYCAAPSATNCSGGAVAGLWRKNNAAPPAGKLVSFQCNVASTGM